MVILPLNPPWSENVATNFGKKFFSLIHCPSRGTTFPQWQNLEIDNIYKRVVTWIIMKLNILDLFPDDL